MDTSPAALGAALSARPPRTAAEWEARPAAVLVPLYRRDGEWHLLFTQRTDHLDEHKGQVAFPGGKIDPGDASPTAAALREADEEIGLRPADVSVIGALDELITVTQWRISPIVGTFHYPYDFVINTHECSAVFGVSLRWLADPANVEARLSQPPIGGRQVPVYYYREYEGHIIWGATARMVRMLLEVVSQVPPG